MTELFKSTKGIVTTDDLYEALLRVKANECDILYIHTDVSFGEPLLKRKEMLSSLYGVLEKLKVNTLIFPTFTFSFCNNENFDIKNTPSKMGVLNEYVRKNIEGVRTSDPLLSVYIVGQTYDLSSISGDESIGYGSTYDKLHKLGKKVKFLFFGADMKKCFTYTHYMEAIAAVPYRYNREFSGSIIDAQGNVHNNQKYKLYSSYGNCVLNPKPIVYNEMLDRNYLSMVDVGDGNICCFNEIDAHKVISDLFKKDICCLTNGMFDINKANTIYNPNGEYVVSVR